MKGRPVKLAAAWQCPDDDVSTRGPSVDKLTTDCAKTPPKKIAGHRPTDSLRDHKAKTRGRWGSARGKVDNRMLRCHTLAPAHGRAEVIRSNHTVRLGEHGSGRYPDARSERGLRGEFGATLATACAEDRAAGAGAHAKAEAVHLGTLAYVRLESSLAHSCISKDQLQIEPERCGMPEGRSQLVKNTALMPSGQTAHGLRALSTC